MALFNQILRGEPLQRNLNTAIMLNMPTWEEAREVKNGWRNA